MRNRSSWNRHTVLRIKEVQSSKHFINLIFSLTLAMHYHKVSVFFLSFVLVPHKCKLHTKAVCVIIILLMFS